MCLWCWGNQGFGESQTAMTCRRLQDDVYILRTAEAVWEMNVPGALNEAGHVITIRA